jgi:hypothetical protein
MRISHRFIRLPGQMPRPTGSYPLACASFCRLLAEGKIRKYIQSQDFMKFSGIPAGSVTEIATY